MQPPPVLEGIESIILDIEGTVCPISFVRETLFPYAIEVLPKILATQWSYPPFEQYKSSFPATARATPEAFAAHVQDLTARDVKIGYLKDLQGYLWNQGYMTGRFATPIYPDVIPQLEHWVASGVKLYVYSSGSISAQKLIFGYTDNEGKADITHLIEDWFDTNTAGPKLEAGSYGRIASSIEKKPSSVLFLSDNVKEISAARDTGLEAILVDRPGNAIISKDDVDQFPLVTSFDQVNLSPAQVGARFWRK